MRFSFLAAGILVLALGLWMASGMLNNNDSEESEEIRNAESAIFKVEYIDVALSTKERNIVLQGQLEPIRHLQLRAATSSDVQEVNVVKGSRVKAGDKIVTLALLDRESDLREAQARVKTALSEQKAATSLRKQGLQSQVQLEQIQAQLASARAQLARVQRDITNTTITAPFDGIINDIPVELGQLVSNGDVMAEIVDDSQFLITANAAQQSVAQLQLGKAVTAELITGETLTGELSFIASVADSDTRSFAVEATLKNPGTNVSSGVSASLVAPVAQIEAVFLTPSALSLGDDGELGVKIVNSENIVEFIPIKLESTSLDGAWVTGIPDNTRVITLGQGFVNAGQLVEPVPAVVEQGLKPDNQEG